MTHFDESRTRHAGAEYDADLRGDRGLHVRVLSYPDAARYMGVASRSTIYSLRKADTSFPEPVQICAGRVGFLIEELDAWLNARAAERKGHK